MNLTGLESVGSNLWTANLLLTW